MPLEVRDCSTRPTSELLVADQRASSHGSGRRISWATMTALWPNMVAWMLSMTKAANAALLVASFVIQWFHHSSGVFAPPMPLLFPSLTLGGESMADRPINELPRLISVSVVA